MTRICVLGLGEAGAAIAADVVEQAVEVHAYDPGDVPTPAGVIRHDEAAAAAADADIVLALTLAEHADAALDAVVDALPAGAIYADLSTGSAGLKQRLAGRAAEAGRGFVDVALMAPVPGRGLRTPALASGPAADAFVATMVRLGMPVRFAGYEAGLAASRKLLRSVVMKGLAAVLIESLRAAEAAGLVTETWENLVAQLTSMDEALVRRLVSGSGQHARRRVDEMEATVQLLTELGVEPTMSRATAAALAHLADHPDDLPPLPEPEPS